MVVLLDWCQIDVKFIDTAFESKLSLTVFVVQRFNYNE